MTDENAKKKYKHLKNIISGKYSTERYAKEDLNEETNLNQVSNELMKSDATLNLADLVKKRPNIDFEPKEEVVEPVKEVKKSKKNSKEE